MQIVFKNDYQFEMNTKGYMNERHHIWDLLLHTLAKMSISKC